jgi:hypothetical protein
MLVNSGGRHNLKNGERKASESCATPLVARAEDISNDAAFPATLKAGDSVTNQGPISKRINDGVSQNTPSSRQFKFCDASQITAISIRTMLYATFNPTVTFGRHPLGMLSATSTYDVVAADGHAKPTQKFAVA